LAIGQLDRGHRVNVVALVDSELTPLAERLQAARVPVRCLAFGRHYLRERCELSRVFLATNTVVIHTHGYRADVQGGAAARRARLTPVSTVHGFTGGDAKNRLYERLQLRSLRRFAAVVAVSQPLVDRLAACSVPRERVQLIPNAYQPAGTPLSRERARKELGISADPGEFVIGWVGRLSREKGADVLVEALGLLDDRSARAVVIGDGPDRDLLEARAAALGLASRIQWLGIVPDAATRFPAFDCFALSSRTEGTPIVLFEAMAAGVPIVATAVGGVPDVVSSEEALLVPPEEPAALAQALQRIATGSADAFTRARRAANRLQAERSLEPWLAAYDAVYRMVSGSPSPA
jgi:glycosyltransferase involved in cell wall biosynthesis